MTDTMELYKSMQLFVKKWLTRVQADDMTEDELNEMDRESKAIGKTAWEMGGLSVMRQLHMLVPQVNYFPKVVELQWSGIGGWRA